MNQDLKKFEKLLKTDTEFQKKLKAAAEKFDGDLTDEKAVFEGILIPVAHEAGLSATFEEYKAYMEEIVNASEKEILEVGEEELAQISGGGKGFAGLACTGPGIGLGGGGGDGYGGGCYFLGFGWGGVACFSEGKTLSPMSGN